MRSFLDNAFKVLAGVLVSIFGIMMTLVFVQVINRYILGLPLFWTEEVVRLLLVWSVMIGLPLVMYLRQEIIVEVLSFNSVTFERWRLRLVDLCSILFCLILSYYGYQFVLRAMPTLSPTLSISRAWFSLPIPVGAALATIAILLRPTVGAKSFHDRGPEGELQS